MRTLGKKPGKLATVLIAGSALIGCKTTIPEPVNPLVEAVNQYDGVMSKIESEQKEKINQTGEKAKEDYTKELDTQRKTDLVVIKEAEKAREQFDKDKAEFDKLCDNVLFTYPGTIPSTLANPVTPSSVPTRGSLLVPQKNDLKIHVYGSSEKRTDKNAYHFCGGGVEAVKPINKNWRWYAGGSLGNSNKDNQSLTSLVNHNGNVIEFYGGIRGALVKVGKFEITAGLAGKFRFQEDNISTSDTLGTHDFKDTTSIPGIGASAGMRYGPFFVRREFNTYLGGEGRHEGLETAAWKAGIGKVWVLDKK